jgi:outer membrane protein W
MKTSQLEIISVLFFIIISTASYGFADNATISSPETNSKFSTTDNLSTDINVENKKQLHEETEQSSQGAKIFDDYFVGHLQLGTRSAYRALTKKDSGHRGGYSYKGNGTYLGTIYGLDEEQNAAPLNFYINYYFNKYIGIEINYDKIEAQTVAVNPSTMVDKTDGNVTLSGPTLNLLVKYPNSTQFAPYCGIGLGFYSGDFDPDPEWEWSSQYDGHAYNHMDVDNVVGVILTAGVEWNFDINWSADLSVQYINADVDATYHGYYDDVLYTTQTGHFPMNNVAFRLGFSYKF